MEEENNKKIVLTISLILLLITIVGITYAAFQYTKKGTKENEITTGTVSFVYNETSNGVTLTDALPLNDEKGKTLTNDTSQKYFDFDVTSTLGGDITIPYFVYAVDMTEEKEKELDSNYVKIYLTDQDDNAYEGYEDVPTYEDLDDVKGPEEVDGKLLYQDTFYESGVKEFRLRMWVSDKYEVSEESKTFKIRVDVSTDASIIPKDKKGPTCIVLNQNPTNANRDEDITMTIKCTDESGTVTSNMKSNNVHVLLNNEEVEPTKKELTEGMALTEATNNGVQHTLTLNGFEKEGPIKIKIDSGVVSDKYNNTNEEIEIDTGVKINKRVTVILEKSDGVESISPEKGELYCDITEGSTCNIELPSITPKEGYDVGYWTEDQSLTSGKTGSIEVSENKTYYAKANDIEAPVCKLESTEPTSGNEVEPSGTVKIVVNCTDNSGSISNDLTKENISVTYDGSEGTADTTVDSGTTIDNGKKYTITLTNFSSPGLLATTIKAGAIKDASNNQMIALPITTGITIKDLCTPSSTSTLLGLKYNTDTSLQYEKGCDSTHNMYQITHNNVTDYRYIGSDPYNYVQIDGESSLWRIMGVFNDPVASGEESGKKIKLIRDESIGNYSWDNTTGTTYGSNNWSNATLQKILNSGPYYNKQNGTCSTGTTLGATKACDFSSTGLSTTLRGMIAKMKWYLGGYNGGYNWVSSPHSTEKFYSAERGSTVPSGAPTRWDGYVGLMYPSDYGFTYANGVDNTCYSNENNCNNGTPSNGWLFNRQDQWTLTPYSGDTYQVNHFQLSGYVDDSNARYDMNRVRPVVYLKSSIKITGGSGTKSNPYKIQ